MYSGEVFRNQNSNAKSNHTYLRNGSKRKEKRETEGGEMGQLGKVLADKSGDPSQIPGHNTEEARIDSFKMSSDLYTLTIACVHRETHS